MNPTKKDITELVDKLAAYGTYCAADSLLSEQYAPIRIGDILEKIYAQDDDCGGMENSVVVEDLIALWRDCGFTKSLQEIIEASGWEKKCLNGNDVQNFGVKCKCCQSNLYLKSSKANELAKFLIQIFK